MPYIPAMSALHTPRLTGAEAASVLVMAHAAGDDDESRALADLFASLGARADEGPQGQRPETVALSAALRDVARQTAAWLS